MAERNDGGPAFPRAASTDAHDAPCNVYQDQQGMALRDWFAGQALSNPSICTGSAHEWQLREWFRDRSGITSFEIAAKQAGEYADAMLAERGSR